MSKERLEDKIVEFRQLLALGHVNMGVLNKAHEIHELVIEQAERVQELEEIEQEYVDLNNDFTNMALERKRYREAFNKSREIWDKAYENYKGNKVEYLDGMLYGAKFIIDIFEKALEESE